MNLQPFLKRLIVNVGKSLVRELTRKRPDDRTARSPQTTRGSQPTPHAPTSSSPTNSSAQSRSKRWDIAKNGLPDFGYRPDDDGIPDPGEVVWTWIPYEENNGEGKDRPVLVVACVGDTAICAQMTSKDHAQSSLYQDEYHRWWLDIGNGNWDRANRPSEVRLDILWQVPFTEVRRIGGFLEKNRYLRVIAALKEIHK
ncbi:type II toxin-antitoxin system PemK/MazF family toxin [Arcanobacterium bovis]|uniref:Type II toxin-antitoxin system PemK/MazF family toxin n=1 Tax=Arcanobacterium bovis TaxID=2529275 RepID=A0A4Q9V1V3_9ACTO|nr:type II toxin-antitoxin system PemK/MazF family toxin [Arcanobacterium bovis]TBW22015.1 type II toxin-antitoxin system PemK/MazF family toxin [Arcanobacterium bovis]